MRSIIIFLCSFCCLGVTSQSLDAIREKYPDDMYTEIDGKEVRVNTLSKRLIDSLESLPPMKRIMAIYRVERVAKAEENVKPTETHVITEFDYWENASVQRLYNVYRNNDGTTKIEDGNGNWMRFETEYPVNEYTGEKSSTPIKGESYCGFRGKKDVVLLGAHRILPNGFELNVDGKKNVITMTNMALGLSYKTKKKQILSAIWYEWISEDNFELSFKSLFKDNESTTLVGSCNDTLIDCRNITLSDIGGRIVKGGFYSKKNQYMYFMRNEDNSISSDAYIMKVYPDSEEIDRTLELIHRQMKSDKDRADYINANHDNIMRDEPSKRMALARLVAQFNQMKKVHQMEIDKLKKDVDISSHDGRKAYDELKSRHDSEENAISSKMSSLRNEMNEAYRNPNELKNRTYEALNLTLIPCIPTDKIKEVILGEKVSEIRYLNGDYIKISKLRNGEVFDCKVHRPNGLWTVKQDENYNIHSEYVFTKGMYKGLVYNYRILGSNYAFCLSSLDMLNHRMMREERLYEPTNNRWLTLFSSTGEIREYVEEEQARRNAIEKAKYDKQQEIIRSAYYQKYGKSNVDNMLSGNIHIGMPISVVKALCYTEHTDEMMHGDWYKVFYAGSSYDYSKNLLVPIDVRRAPRAWVSYWLVLVSDGVVRSVHKMRVY